MYYEYNEGIPRGGRPVDRWSLAEDEPILFLTRGPEIVHMSYVVLPRPKNQRQG